MSGRDGVTRLTLVALLVLSSLTSSLAAQAGRRILFVPLDDRPSSLQFPVRIGAIGGVSVLTPPRGLLGRFTEPGRPEAIIAWLRRQPLGDMDAVIVSLDMLAYGGLVASRVGTSARLEMAERRLGVLRELRRRAPHLPILASSAIMRLAPTADGTNEAYRVELARWAELAMAPDSTSVAEVRRLEMRIPPTALAAYRATRERNARINRSAVQLVRDGVIDRLLLTQDDARAQGVHLAERAQLTREIARDSLGDRIAMQAGTDEAGMLLLARGIVTRTRARLRVAPVYSSPAMRTMLMPYEDEPLQTTVEKLIAAAGAESTTDSAQAELLLFVHTARADAAATARFAAAIGAATTRGTRGVIVADVDPKGDVQGADSALAGALLDQGTFWRLTAYASWNTASNTIGTALAHGLVRQVTPLRVSQRGQQWFLLDRLLDDVVYRRVLRPEAAASARTRGWNAATLTRVQSDSLADFLRARLRDEAPRWLARSGVATAGRCGPRGTPRLRLPWDRLFEAELAFELERDCGDPYGARAASRRTPPSSRTPM